MYFYLKLIPMWTFKKLFSFSSILFCLFIALSVVGQTKKPIVVHLKIADNIDPRTNRYAELGLEYAESVQADYVILELDTYGGALTDADEIRTRILDYKRPIYAFINKDAASAGALISIACDSIYMAKGSSIGAATVVTGEGTAAPDKYQSYMRSIMRSTAEAKGRDPRIAEAMVDEDIDLDSIAKEGKVLTFSVSEAIKWEFCEAQTETIDEIMKRSGVTDYELKPYNLSGSEKIIALFLNPFVSGILILIIIGGIYFELQTPGVGFPIIASAIAAILYFTPYYLNGLAENWEIILFFIGIILIGLEIFVFPGFGVAGILGITLTVLSLILVMINNDGFSFDFVPSADLFSAIATAISALLGSIILLFFGGTKLADSKAFRRIALVETQDTSKGFTSNVYASNLKGQKGVAYTILRPSGKVLIDGEIYDAFTGGDFIERDEKIIVISISGTSLKVRKRT